MWLFTRYGMLSVVRDREHDTHVLLRARRREHLERVLEACHVDSLGSIRETPHNDYRWRKRVSVDVWQSMARTLAADVDYDNFKGEIARTERGSDYELALHDVWEIMREALSCD